jgi:adenylate kinase family enzyme
LDLRSYERINVCGTSSTGKSTLARRLATLIGGEYVELDAFHHRENWTEAPLDEFRALVAEAVAPDKWVVDGGYSKARDILWARVQLVIWLDYPLPIILWRLTRRTIRRGLTREKLWNTGNVERMWRHFFVPKDSLYWWVLTSYRRRRAEFRRVSLDPANSHIEFIRFSKPREAESWLREKEARLRTPSQA